MVRMVTSVGDRLRPPVRGTTSQAASIVGLAFSLFACLACGSSGDRSASSGEESLEIVRAFGNDDGRFPYGALVASKDRLFGTNVLGGKDDHGTLYAVDPDGSEASVLHEFSGADGSQPYNSLAFTDTEIFGITLFGGDHDEGVLFSIDRDGSNFEVLHHFSGNEGDGGRPYTAPILVGDTLYGMTFGGGAHSRGTIYRVETSDRSYATIYHFEEGSGVRPFGALTWVEPWFYGMASDHLDEDEFGVIFRLRPSGLDYEILHRFEGGRAGGYPYDSLVHGGDLTFYGTTLGFYKDLDDEGVLFRFDAAIGSYLVLKDFEESAGDGAKPNGNLVISPDGKTLYGTSHGTHDWIDSAFHFGENDEYGTLFRLDPDGGNFEVLHTFRGGIADGEVPERTPVLLRDTLYGTTAYGGTVLPDAPRGCGLVYRFMLPE